MPETRTYDVQVHIQVEAKDSDDAYQVVMAYLDPIHEQHHPLFEYEIPEDAAIEIEDGAR